MNSFGELIDLKTIRVISLLLENNEEFFHLQKISQKASVPISTTFRIVNKLVKKGIIEVMNVGNFKIYRIASKWKKADPTKIVIENRELIDVKISKIISLLIKNKSEFFHLQKISQKSGVPISTTFRLIRKLVDLGLVDKTEVGNFKIYKIADNKKIARLGRLMFNK